jgi:hypothetical protein
MTLTRTDLMAGSAIALAMACIFTWIGGRPLFFTFVPGLVATWIIFAWMHARQVELPNGSTLYPFYFGVLAWQFVHFTEEFTTGFADKFPALFGAAPFSTDLFIAINMLSYFGLVTAFILTFVFGIRFFLIPVLFFAVYGAIGNAVSHTYWIVAENGYFPGAVTAQVYWIAGPLLLAEILGARQPALIATGGFAVLLGGVLGITMSTA